MQSVYHHKAPAYILYATMGLIFVMSLMVHQPGHNWGDDFALYINQARSIVEGTVEKTIEINKFTLNESTHKPLGLLF